MFDSMQSYFEEIYDFHRELKKELYANIFFASKMYIDSDLPIAFVKTVGDSFFAQMDYYDIFDKRIRREQMALLAARNNRRKFERVCEAHNQWVREFEEVCRMNSRDRFKLMWYIDFNNARSVDEVFKEKTIEMRNLAREIFYNFISRLEQRIHALEAKSFSVPEMREPSFLRYENDEPTIALGKMVNILSQTVGTE